MTKQELNKIFDECHQLAMLNSAQSKDEIYEELKSFSTKNKTIDMAGIIAYSVHRSFEMNVEYINLVLSKIFIS